MNAEVNRYEIVKGYGEQGSFAELWDRTKAPSGLALELRASDDGKATLTGYNIDVPWSVVRRFLSEGRSYLGLD